MTCESCNKQISDTESYFVCDDGPVLCEKCRPDPADIERQHQERVGKIADRFKWCMHVVGPDDMIAAESYGVAVSMAREHNKAFISSMEETDVCAVAVPALWPWSDENHAECLAKEQRCEMGR